MTIALDKQALDDAEKVALHKLSQKVKAPGFRAGKVPASVAAKHIDQSQLMQQTLDDALSKAVAEAFTAEGIQVLSRPEVEVLKFEPGKTLEFSAEADVLPKIKLGDYKKLDVPAEKATVTAAEVNEVIERIRSGMSEKKAVKRAAKNGDVLLIDFVGKKDDVAFEGGTAEDYELELGSNSFIPGFEEGLVGAKPGDKKDLKLKFPKNYHVADLAGADVVFETTVKEVREKQLPELDDEFAKKTGAEGVTTLKALKDDIKRELLTNKEREATDKRKDALVQKLIDVSEVPTPEVLIGDQVQNLEQDMRQNLMYQNVTLEQYLRTQGFKDEADWKEKEVTPAAKKRVQAGLVLAELSKVLEIEATADQLAEHINRYKQQYAGQPDMAKRFDEPEIQREVANRLITEKTVDTLVELNA